MSTLMGFLMDEPLPIWCRAWAYLTLTETLVLTVKLCRPDEDDDEHGDGGQAAAVGQSFFVRGRDAAHFL